MRRCRLSVRAAIDIARIADYTIERFSITQARRYRIGLETWFDTHAENSLLGRSAEEFAPNLRRFEHESHIVFYEPREESLPIVRVLHESMDAPSHLQQRDEEDLLGSPYLPSAVRTLRPSVAFGNCVMTTRSPACRCGLATSTRVSPDGVLSSPIRSI